MKIELGSCDKLPHYSVVGDPQDFYIYINETGRGFYSKWIKGKDAFRLYHKLAGIKNKKELKNELKRAYEKYKKELS